MREKKINYKEDLNSLTLLLELFKVFNSKRKRQLLLSFLIIILASIAEILTIYLILPFSSLLLEGSNNYEKNFLFNFFYNIDFNYKESLFLLGSFLVLFIIISSSLRLLNLWININITQKIAGELSYDFYKKTLYKPYSFHVNNNSSIIISALNKSIEGTSTAIDAALQLVSSMTIIISILLALALINLRITLFALIIFLFLYLIVFFFTKNILFKNSSFSVKKNSLRFKELSEGLRAIREIIIDGNQQYFINNFSKVDRQLRNKIIQNSFIIGSPRYLFECISLILIIASSLFFLNNNIQYNSFSYLATFALGAQKILPLIQTIYRMVSNIRAKKFEVLEIINMMNSKITKYPNFKKTYNFRNSIRFVDVTFSYENNFDVIKKINLNIGKGEKIGIIGSTGSGKSTLLDIFMGLLRPTSGDILVDGISIINSSKKNNHINKWRTCISHVPQNIFIADTSFAENIAFGYSLDQIDMNKVKSSCKRAMIDQFIINTEKKYFTNLGEGGIKLSGGQRQRIAIARALYKNSSVLVLDEATSALDNKTEKEIMETIRSLDDVTIVIVTHRKNTINYCDRIIEIDKGCIVS